ncbi:MAG: hypothetical protein LH650_08620 [Chloroflexi bacterium]|nr:hypothetical protein [Chloroflexota bacterium]
MSRTRTIKSRNRGTAVRLLMTVVVVAMILGMVLTGTQARAQSPSPAASSPAASTIAGVTFDTPTGSGSLTTPLTFSTTFRSDETPDRVELLTRLRDGTTDLVRSVQPRLQADGSYIAELVQAGFTPANTTLDLRFRVTTPSGVAVGPSSAVTVDDDRFQWQTMSGPTVTLHWYEGDEAFGRRALDIGQQAIDQAASLLGVTEVKPVDFFIYSTEEAFRGALAPGARENVGGQANPAIRTMVGNISADEVGSDWVDTLVTHELTHIVFSDAVSNAYHFPPRWLNEGLAVYLSEGYGVSDRAQVKDAANGGNLIPLTGLVGLFPTTYARFSLAYAESVAAVDFFIDTYGKDKLVQLITSYRGGVTDDEAFTAATGSDFAAFDDAFMAAQGASEPQPYGPLPAPSGPLPSGWNEPTPAPSSASSAGAAP